MDERKDIRFWLNIKFHQRKWDDYVEWNIPYLVVLRKYKDEGLRNQPFYDILWLLQQWHWMSVIPL